MFELMVSPKNGVLSLDVSDQNDKRLRGLLSSMGGRATIEKLTGTNSWNADHLSEPANTLFWPHNHAGNILPRGAWGSFTWAIPALRKPGTADEYEPLESWGKVDKDFISQQAYSLTPIPEGVPTVILATTKHGDKDKIAISPCASSLISHWKPNNPPKYSTHMYDMNGDELSNERHAGLQTAFRVRQWSDPCAITFSPTDKRYGIALNAVADATNVGYLFTSYGNIDVLHSSVKSGPLCFTTFKHELTYTSDAPIRAGGLSTNAYFVGSGHPYDAPLEFEEKPYPEVQDAGIPHWVHLYYDANKKHNFSCGERDGLWRWFVRIPIAETPKCTSSKYKETSSTRTYTDGSAIIAPKQVHFVSSIYGSERHDNMLGRRYK